MVVTIVVIKTLGQRSGRLLCAFCVEEFIIDSGGQGVRAGSAGLKQKDAVQ